MKQVEMLTKRELQCLQFAALDKSLQETADALCLSYDTVKTHRRFLLRKLGCHSMVGALMLAFKQRIIKLN